MSIGDGLTIEAADIQAIKDDVDVLVSSTMSSVATNESTTSTSYTDLATSGPSVTLTTGSVALVILSAQIFNNTAGKFSFMSCAVSGATTDAADDDDALFFESSAANDQMGASRARLYTGLTPGSNTFTAKYRVDAGTGSFLRRSLIVIPFGV